MNQTKYIGTELELFENALNWKQYWFQQISPHIGKKILDVGAGRGATASLFSQHKLSAYTAIEPDTNNIEILHYKKNQNEFNPFFQYKKGDMHCLEKNDLYDTILYIDVLEHIQNDNEELLLASKHLSPGGNIIVLSPAHQWLFSEFDQAVGHYRRYNKKTLLHAKPTHLKTKDLYYLDSVGTLASIANKILLNSGSPTKNQIMTWDNWLVPTSKHIDKLVRFHLGKSIIGVFSLPEKIKNK